MLARPVEIGVLCARYPDDDCDDRLRHRRSPDATPYLVERVVFTACIAPLRPEVHHDS